MTRPSVLESVGFRVVLGAAPLARPGLAADWR